MAPTSWRSRPQPSRPADVDPDSQVAPSEWGPGPAVWRQAGGPPPGQRHRATAPSREPGKRFVDYDEASDMPERAPLRRGSKVVHEHFCRGEVMKIVTIGELAVVASFPGWGEKKVLARFLKLG